MLVAIVTFAFGVLADRAFLNREWDNDRCDKIIGQIDNVVEHFHERFSDSEKKRQNASTLFDYQIISLVDDTTLLPIIGSRAFDGEYIRLVSEIYKLSQKDPMSVTPDEREILLKAVNKGAVDLKKVINSNMKGIRIWKRS